MSYLSEALPVKGRALSLRASFNRSLVESCKYLLEVCIEAIRPDLFSRATQRLDSLNPKSKLSGLLSALHADFFDAAEQEDIQKVNKIVNKLAKDNFQVNKIKYINLSSLNSYYTPLVQNIFSQETVEKAEFFPLSSQDFKRVRNSVQHGVRILKGSFPDFYIEFQELVSEVLILNARGLKAGSSSDLFGMIYKCCLYRWEKITDVLDFLTHEQSHLYVHLLNKDDPIIFNPLELHESPLRKEKRPLIGNYHATFVLARVHHVLTQALARNEIPEDERDYCQELLSYYKKRFYVGFDILQNHAQMTPLGRELIFSARKLV